VAANVIRIYAPGVSTKKNRTEPIALAPPKSPDAKEIAQQADDGEDISRFFSGRGRMMPPIPLARRSQGRLYDM
jgi:hypothetical protein